MVPNRNQQANRTEYGGVVSDHVGESIKVKRYQRTDTKRLKIETLKKYEYVRYKDDMK